MLARRSSIAREEEASVYGRWGKGTLYQRRDEIAALTAVKHAMSALPFIGCLVRIALPFRQRTRERAGRSGHGRMLVRDMDLSPC